MEGRDTLAGRPNYGGVAADRHAFAKQVAGGGVGGGEPADLAPVSRAALVALEDVRRVSVCAYEGGPDDGRIFADRHVEAEPAGAISVCGGELLHLAPVVWTARVAPEDVGRAVVAGQGRRCPNNGGVAADRDAEAEGVECLGVGGGEPGHLAPVVRPAQVAPEDVCRAGAATACKIAGRPHDGGVAADRHAVAEAVWSLRSGGGELLHLAPVVRAALVALEDVGRAFAA